MRQSIVIALISGLVGAVVVVLGQQPPQAPSGLSVAGAQPAPAGDWVPGSAIGDARSGIQFAVNRLSGKIRACSYTSAGNGVFSGCKIEP
ncbi:MAG TPA: hypothetical protein VIE44_02025 [Methylomirabilota bacterium]|jgi:hypothetical protein